MNCPLMHLKVNHQYLIRYMVKMKQIANNGIFAAMSSTPPIPNRIANHSLYIPPWERLDPDPKPYTRPASESVSTFSNDRKRTDTAGLHASDYALNSGWPSPEEYTKVVLYISLEIYPFQVLKERCERRRSSRRSGSEIPPSRHWEV